MIKLTPMKLRRMSLGLRQVDIVLNTGIHTSRLSAIENELVTPSERELELIENYLSGVQRDRNLVAAARKAVAKAEHLEVPT